MINTILFDLDGTLLPMKTEEFMKLYFYHMGLHFDGWIEPDKLAKYILESTEVMIKTRDGRTNEEKFMDYFAGLIDGNIEKYKKHFEEYYETLFDNVKQSTYKSEAMIKAVKLLREKGYTLVIATNPVFPYRANLHRIEWAGLNPEWFYHISSFEENKYTKPYPDFYQEVLDKINKEPSECMMVGNDAVEDLAAGKLGMKTFLTTDCMINEKNFNVTADYQGTYQDFLIMAESLPIIKKQ